MITDIRKHDHFPDTFISVYAVNNS